MDLKNFRNDLLSFDFFSLLVESSLFIAAHLCLFLYWPDLNILIITIGFITGLLFLVLGHEIGAHRYFSHNSFDCPPILRSGIHILLALSNYGSALSWRVLHKIHHTYSDQKNDPTSPRNISFLTTYSNAWKFLFHFSGKYPLSNSLIRIIKSTPEIQILKTWRLWHPFITLVFATLLFWMDPQYFIMFFSLPSLFVSYALNSINYFGHSSEPKNVVWLNLMTLGGGWHKNHHENQTQFLFHSHWDFVGQIIKLSVKEKNGG